ncbi:SDR family oxidoreductase [Orrella marina]|nr:SDR family oxidoreductase [Orrella marina]
MNKTQQPGAVLVTGGSRGIGRSTAIEAARAGYPVCITYVQNETEAHSVVEQAKSYGVQARAIQADVGDLTQVRSLFEALDVDFPPLYGLVNNAGIIGQRGSMLDISAESVADVFAVNVLGLIECCRQFLLRVDRVPEGSGRECVGVIVNLSSGAAQEGAPFHYIPYGASKAAVETFSVGLAKEVAAKGVRVNVVSPGVIDTDIHYPDGVRKSMEALAQTIAMGRMGTPQEIAHAIMWMLSAEASYVSGAVLRVAGGGRILRRT